MSSVSKSAARCKRANGGAQNSYDCGRRIVTGRQENTGTALPRALLDKLIRDVLASQVADVAAAYANVSEARANAREAGRIVRALLASGAPAHDIREAQATHAQALALIAETQDTLSLALANQREVANVCAQAIAENSGELLAGDPLARIEEGAGHGS